MNWKDILKQDKKQQLLGLLKQRQEEAKSLNNPMATDYYARMEKRLNNLMDRIIGEDKVFNAYLQKLQKPYSNEVYEFLSI